MLKDAAELICMALVVLGVGLAFGLPAALILAGVAGVAFCEVR